MHFFALKWQKTTTYCFFLRDPTLNRIFSSQEKIDLLLSWGQEKIISSWLQRGSITISRRKVRFKWENLKENYHIHLILFVLLFQRDQGFIFFKSLLWKVTTIFLQLLLRKNNFYIKFYKLMGVTLLKINFWKILNDHSLQKRKRKMSKVKICCSIKNRRHFFSLDTI